MPRARQACGGLTASVHHVRDCPQETAGKKVSARSSLADDLLTVLCYLLWTAEHFPASADKTDSSSAIDGPTQRQRIPSEIRGLRHFRVLSGKFSLQQTRCASSESRSSQRSDHNTAACHQTEVLGTRCVQPFMVCRTATILRHAQKAWKLATSHG